MTAAIGSLALAGGLLGSYASRVEPQWPEVVRLTLPLPHLPSSLDGMTIAHISDLHAGKVVTAPKIRRFVNLINSLQPDVIVITGDMLESAPKSASMCARELGQLCAPQGVYAIMGNHERRLLGDQAQEPFRQAGLNVLCNAAQRIGVDGDALWIVGLDDLVTRHGDLALALRGVPDRACKVLLAHEPDFADQAARFPIDLQLSGHTHGGQVRLPGIGPLILPVLGRKYPMGLYRVGNMWVYTNRGLGVASPPVRFNCRPEITLLTLHAGKEEI
jgi:predicted MPP superfamily phosphohydrolase